MYCLDRLPEPAHEFYDTEKRVARYYGGSLKYKQVDVQNADAINKVTSEIADGHGRMDGLIAAAGVQYVVPALEYPPEKISEVSQPLSLSCAGPTDRLRVDDEHQLWRGLPFSYCLCTANGEVQVPGLDPTDWIHERTHRQQRLHRERVQLVQGRSNPTWPEPGHGVG